jgi:hypothetical protein
MFIFIQQQILITYTPLLTWLYFSLYVELQLILKFIPKKWGGDGGNIGSIMSMIGKNCQSVDNCIFRHCTYIYCLKIHNSLMFYLLTMYIIMFSCCNVKRSKISAKLNSEYSEDNIILKNKTVHRWCNG